MKNSTELLKEIEAEREREVEAFVGAFAFYAEINPHISAALREVLMRMPSDPWDALRHNTFVIFPERCANYTFKFNCLPELNPMWFIVLADYLNRSGRAVVVGVIAHELAHVFNLDDSGGEACESAADSLATVWGFGAEIAASKLPVSKL